MTMANLLVTSASTALPCQLQPPFNSVLHLHLHAIALPWLPGAPRWKYWPHAPWWLPADKALQRLEPPGGGGGGRHRRAGDAAAAANGTPCTSGGGAEDKRLL